MELIRVFNKKRVLVLLILLIVNGVFFYKESTDLEMYRIYNELILECNNKHQDAAVTKTAANLVVREYQTARKGISKKQEFKDAKALFLEKIDYIRTYSSKKEEQIKQSKVMLSSSVFSDKDSFSYLNILKTRADLQKIKDEKVTVSNGIWLEKIVDYKLIYYIVIIALSVVVYSFLEERKNGMIFTQFAAKNGRGKMLFKRFVILLVTSLIFTLLCYLEVAIISLKLYGGIEGINDSVCSDEVFAMASMGLSRIMWLIVNAIRTAVSICAVALFMWGMISCFSNSNIGLCATIIICVTSVVLGRIISAKSVFRFFKFFNVEYLIDGSKSWFVYDNWGYDNIILGVDESTLIIMALIFVIAMVMLVKNCILSNSVTKIGIVEKIFMKTYELFMSILSKLPLGVLEFFKVLVSQRGGLIVIIVAILFFNMTPGYTIRYSPEDVAIASFCYDYKGANGETLYEIKDKLSADLKIYEKDIDLAQRAAITRREIGYVDYLIEKTQEGVDVSLISNKEYEYLFGSAQTDNQQFMALLGIMLIVVVNSGAVSYEKRTGVLAHIMTGKERDGWVRNKIIHNGLFVTLITIVLYGIYYYKLIKIYDLENFNASIQSLMMFGEYPLDVPIWLFVALDLLLKVIILMAVGGIAFLVSTIFNYDVGYLVSLIILIPYFLYDIGIKLFANLSVARFMAFMPLWIEDKVKYNLTADIIIIVVGIGAYVYGKYRLIKKKCIR